MSTLMTLEIEGLPPSVNQMYRTGKYGKRYKRGEVREWQDYVAGEIRKTWGTREAYTWPVGVRIEFHVSSCRKWDIDNRLKALLDVLMQGGIIEDDAQVYGLNVRKVTGMRERTVVMVRAYGTAEEDSN